MNTFRLNLIKDQVPGFRQRRVIFWQMHLYVLMAGALLVYECFEATKEVLAHHRILLDSQVIEADFRSEYSEESDMFEYLQDLCGDITRQAARMSRVENIMDSKALLSPVLAGIARPLDPGMSLVRFELKDAAGFEFDIACSRESGANVDSAMLIGAWEKDPVLSKVITTIKPALVQRQLVESRSMMLLKYEGTIKTGAI